MVQSGHRFGLLVRRQICLNPVWLGGLRSTASLALSRRPFGLATLALTAQPPNWIRKNLANPRRTKPAGLTESWSVIGIIIHHSDTILYDLLNWLSRTKSISCGTTLQYTTYISYKVRGKPGVQILIENKRKSLVQLRFKVPWSQILIAIANLNRGIELFSTWRWLYRKPKNIVYTTKLGWWGYPLYF